MSRPVRGYPRIAQITHINLRNLWMVFPSPAAGFRSIIRPQMPIYEPEAWRDCDEPAGDVSAREQCRLLDLLGRINYRILSGNRVYVEVGGVVYKTVYGGYWRSVFTGIEHYLLHCEQVSSAVWKEEKTNAVDLPIAYSNGGWTTSGHSLSFILNRE